MALDRIALLQASVWRGRTLEWSLLGAVVVALALTLWQQARELQGQAEVAAVKTTLGALRTAMVIAHVQKALPRHAPVQQSTNPFETLSQVPVNYAGLAGPNDLERIAPGSWMFDPACQCVGYRPMDEAGLDSPRGALALWFKLGGPGESVGITAAQTYVWRGQAVH